MEVTEQLLIKWEHLINACKAYYVECEPTGLSDSEYDNLEFRAATEDKFFVRDYVLNTYLKGAKTKNSYIEKIKKTKVTDQTMLQALESFEAAQGQDLFCTLKYDGSSLAIYLDPLTGVPLRIVTVGNLNLDDYGVDQTWKLLKFLPSRFPKGIVAIQAEALIDTARLTTMDPERARQKANGLINSKYSDTEVNDLLTIRAYRYYLQPGSDLELIDYPIVLGSFDTVRSPLDGHILFAPAEVWRVKDLGLPKPGYTETDRTITRTGTFLNDGWVVYNKTGKCLGALKFAGAGLSTETIKTKVNSIQWNNQISKGKDSWSANIIIDPVVVKGCTIKKPSAGSVKKMCTLGISPGAEVSIILANSTIPMCGEVFSPGTGDYMWPTCSCGYIMSESDIYGSLLKCGNQNCTERADRMGKYLGSLGNISSDLDLNKFLVIDRVKWETTGINIKELLSFVESDNLVGYYDYLASFLTTKLQKRNLDLVFSTSFLKLKEVYLASL